MINGRQGFKSQAGNWVVGSVPLSGPNYSVVDAVALLASHEYSALFKQKNASIVGRAMRLNAGFGRFSGRG